MTDSDKLITDEVESTVERLEEMEDQDELDPLDVQATVDLRGHIKDITAVLTVGGPYIEVNLDTGKVYGAWGGSTCTMHVYKNEEFLNQIADFYEQQFEEVVLA